MQSNAMQSKAMQSNVKQCKTKQSKAKQCKATNAFKNAFILFMKKKRTPHWGHAGFMFCCSVLLCLVGDGCLGLLWCRFATALCWWWVGLGGRFGGLAAKGRRSCSRAGKWMACCVGRCVRRDWLSGLTFVAMGTKPFDV